MDQFPQNMPIPYNGWPTVDPQTNPYLLQREQPFVWPPENMAYPGYVPVTPTEQPGRKNDSCLRKLMRGISSLIFVLLCLSLVGGPLLFAMSDDPQKNYFGYRIYNVVTSSMTPKEDGSSPPGGFKEGTVILVKLCAPEEIRVGDIITFNPSVGDSGKNTFLTHRVVEIKQGQNGEDGIFFVTQGDANNSPDPPISGSMVIGKKVFHIPFSGDALQWIRSNFVLSMIIFCSFFATVFMLRWYFAKPEGDAQAGGNTHESHL